MLMKRKNGAAKGAHLARSLAGASGGAIDRRTFFRRSGMAAGGLAAMPLMGATTVRKAEAQTAASGLKIAKSVCTHCSVGCTVIAEVENLYTLGELDPEAIHTSGIFVDAVVRADVEYCMLREEKFNG